MDIKTGVKLACKPAFISIFPSEESPMLLARPKVAQEDVPSE